jgi:hypothetical protein
MLRIKLFLACAFAAVFVLTTGAFGQDMNPNQRTFFTFSQAVELPGGETLPAGKYLFKIVDSPSNRHVIQILSEDEKKVHATILAIPAQRRDPSDEPEVRFMEAAANMPPAIRTWWYPGRTIGHEFIYPKAHALRLAANQRDAVLTAQGTSVDEMRTAELARINASGQEAAWKAEATEVEIAQATAPPAPRPMPERTPAPTTVAVDTTRTELPRTAGFLPLVALLGLGSLAGAATLRMRRRK